MKSSEGGPGAWFAKEGSALYSHSGGDRLGVALACLETGARRRCLFSVTIKTGLLGACSLDRVTFF